MRNTLAPLSVADATIFGVWISTNPAASSVARIPCERQRAEPEHRAAARVAQRDGGVVELERQLFLQLGNAEVDRRRLRGRGDQGERRVDELDAARCLLVELGGALDGEDRLVEPLRDLGALPHRR